MQLSGKGHPVVGPMPLRRIVSPLNRYAARQNKELLGARPLLYKLFPNEVDWGFFSKFQAVCDLPASILYRELDRRFPGARFILTTRCEQEWKKSAQNHFNAARRPQQTHCLNRMRLDAYGSILYDEDRHLSALRRHNREVREYFRTRQRQLLEIDITAGAGWNDLCSFLEVGVPDAVFPHENKSDHKINS